MEENKESKFENNFINIFIFIVSMIGMAYYFLDNDFGNGMTLFAILGFIAFIALVLFIKSMFSFGKFIEFVIKH